MGLSSVSMGGPCNKPAEHYSRMRKRSVLRIFIIDAWCSNTVNITLQCLQDKQWVMKLSVSSIRNTNFSFTFLPAPPIHLTKPLSSLLSPIISGIHASLSHPILLQLFIQWLGSTHQSSDLQDLPSSISISRV